MYVCVWVCAPLLHVTYYMSSCSIHFCYSHVVCLLLCLCVRECCYVVLVNNRKNTFLYYIFPAVEERIIWGGWWEMGSWRRETMKVFFNTNTQQNNMSASFCFWDRHLVCRVCVTLSVRWSADNEFYISEKERRKSEQRKKSEGKTKRL